MLDVHTWGWEYVENEYGDFGYVPFPKEYTEIPPQVYDYSIPIGPINVCSYCNRSHVVGERLMVWCEDVP